MLLIIFSEFICSSNMSVFLIFTYVWNKCIFFNIHAWNNQWKTRIDKYYQNEREDNKSWLYGKRMFSRDVCYNSFLQTSHDRLTDRLTNHPLQLLQSRPSPTRFDTYRVRSVTCNHYHRYRYERDDTYVNRKDHLAYDLLMRT